jgi:hypothetical protein
LDTYSRSALSKTKAAVQSVICDLQLLQRILDHSNSHPPSSNNSTSKLNKIKILHDSPINSVALLSQSLSKSNSSLGSRLNETNVTLAESLKPKSNISSGSRLLDTENKIFDLSFTLFQKPEIKNVSHHSDFNIFVNETDNCPIFIQHQNRTIKRSWDRNAGLTGLRDICIEEFGIYGDIYIKDVHFQHFFLAENITDIEPGMLVDYRKTEKINETELKESKLISLMNKLLQKLDNDRELKSRNKKTNSKFNERIAVSKGNLESLRTELYSMRLLFNSFFKTTTNLFEQSATNNNDSNTIFDSFEFELNNFGSNLEGFQDLIEITRKDIARGVRQEKNFRLYLSNEYLHLKNEINERNSQIDTFKKIFKKKWQIDLNRIMIDQERLSSFENIHIDYGQDIVEMDECVDAVCKILEYHETHAFKPINIKLQVGISKEYGMNSVLNELVQIQVKKKSDPFSTLSKFSYFRNVKLNMRKSNLFESELKLKASSWNSTDKLKQLEEIRNEKLESLIRSSFIT